MVRLYMVHHRLNSMQEAVERMVEEITASQSAYTYEPPKAMSHNGRRERKAG